MTLTKDKAGALAFLALAIAYGSFIGDIPLFPGDEEEPFHARTMPMALAWLTAGVSALMLILPKPDNADEGSVTLAFKGLNWRKTAELLGLMIFYGLTLTVIGFIPSTILFLIGGFWVLGERRWKVILLSAIPLTIGFWFILSQLLGIYLSPGEIFFMLGGE